MTSGLSLAAEQLLQAVPFARKLGIEFLELTKSDVDVRAVARLPDSTDHHNHVGGPHAGALFTLGETASGAVVIGAFAAQLGRAVPLTVRAEIVYQKLAMGAVRAAARLGRPAQEVIAELDAGGRPEFPVHVEITTDDGRPAAELTVVWTLRPN